ncbi:MAG: transcriptional repressor [Candidatus Nitrohelix vancouverensis]|uniref:Ferric uptake regulation protein n=1 Tax=Candidatus Nitrohelix vancouverensis TaxID=2705534 RepID=A0A7T0C4G0_9BACT|nr:MAG: transcriptional repressor [Candidatus Nitrohelix vancouverensis]
MKTFLQTQEHFTAEQIHQIVLSHDSAIGIATVYRTMALLVEAGLAKEISQMGEKKMFESIYRKSHHDHLICTVCGRIVEFEHPLIEKYQREVCLAHDFLLNSHLMELRGICSSCR